MVTVNRLLVEKAFEKTGITPMPYQVEFAQRFVNEQNVQMAVPRQAGATEACMLAAALRAELYPTQTILWMAPKQMHDMIARRFVGKGIKCRITARIEYFMGETMPFNHTIEILNGTVQLSGENKAPASIYDAYITDHAPEYTTRYMRDAGVCADAGRPYDKWDDNAIAVPWYDIQILDVDVVNMLKGNLTEKQFADDFLCVFPEEE